MTTTTRAKPQCAICLKIFRTVNGYRWHIENNEDCRNGYEAAEWTAHMSKGVRMPRRTRHTLGHSAYDESKRAEMRTMREQTQEAWRAGK